MYLYWPLQVDGFRFRVSQLTAPWGPCKGARHWCGFRVSNPLYLQTQRVPILTAPPPYGSHPCGLVAPLRNLLATEVHVVAPRLAVGPSARSAPWGTYQRKLNAPPG